MLNTKPIIALIVILFLCFISPIMVIIDVITHITSPNLYITCENASGVTGDEVNTVVLFTKITPLFD